MYSYSHKHNALVKTLAASRAVKFTADRIICPGLLFQRFIILSQSGELSLHEVMKHELSAFPPSLLEAKNQLRPPDKPALLKAIRNHASSAVLPGLKPMFQMGASSYTDEMEWRKLIQLNCWYLCIVCSRTVWKRNCGFLMDLKGQLQRKTHIRSDRQQVWQKTVNITDATKFTGK